MTFLAIFHDKRAFLSFFTSLEISKTSFVYNEYMWRTRSRSSSYLSSRISLISSRCICVCNRDLTQQDGWKNDAKMSRETVHSRSCATFFRHSAVLSLPAVLLRKVPNVVQPWTYWYLSSSETKFQHIGRFSPSFLTRSSSSFRVNAFLLFSRVLFAAFFLCCCACCWTRSSSHFYLLQVFPFGSQNSLLLSRNLLFLFCCLKMSRLPRCDRHPTVDR